MKRLLVLASLLVISACAEELALPNGSGGFSVNPQFFPPNAGGPYGYGSYMAFTLINRTSSAWDKITLRFEVKTRCSRGVSTWKLFASTSIGWEPTKEVKKEPVNAVPELTGELDDSCKVESIITRLVSAENSTTHINTGIDMNADKSEFQAEIEARQEAREKVRAEAEEAEAKAEAKKTAQRKQLAVQREAAAAALRRRIRQNCAALYENTADKKVKDLTVREEQQVRACQELGLYPPT